MNGRYSSSAPQAGGSGYSSSLGQSSSGYVSSVGPLPPAGYGSGMGAQTVTHSYTPTLFSPYYQSQPATVTYDPDYRECCCTIL